MLKRHGQWSGLLGVKARNLEESSQLVGVYVSVRSKLMGAHKGDARSIALQKLFRQALFFPTSF